MTTVKQAYEWVKTGHWSLRQFKEWAQPEQEPVAEVVEDVTGYLSIRWYDDWAPNHGDKLYTTPPKREWVELTDDDIDTIFWGASKTDLLRVREIEAKLKELNT